MAVNNNTWNKIRYTLYQPFYDLAGNAFNEYRQLSIEGLKLKPTEKILIVGAGTGLDLEYLTGQKKITAIDLTSSMVSDLMQKSEELDLPLEALVMDGHELEFPDASFDVVILHLIVAVIPDPDRCLSEVRRVLKPNGRFTIMDKFVPPSGRISFTRKVLNPITNFLFSDITRNVHTLLEDAGLGIDQEDRFKFNLAIVRGHRLKRRKIRKKERQPVVSLKVPEAKEENRITNFLHPDFLNQSSSNEHAANDPAATENQKTARNSGLGARIKKTTPNQQLNMAVFLKFPELETKRLILRRFETTDAENYYQLRSNPAVMEYMDRPLWRNSLEALKNIRLTHQDFKTKRAIWWVLADKRNNQFLGYVGLKDIDIKNKSAEIAYALHPDYWSSGWMTEAVTASLNFLFNQLNAHRCIANINTENEASRGLLKKFGFMKEAVFREDYFFDGEFLDSEIWGLLKREFNG